MWDLHRVTGRAIPSRPDLLSADVVGRLHMCLTPVFSSTGQKTKKPADVGTRKNAVPRIICFGNITSAHDHEITMLI